MNTFGRVFRVSLFGESHGPGVGVVIDGCPSGLPLVVADFISDLQRRSPSAPGTTARREIDTPRIVSGIFGNVATGSPILIEFANRDADSREYEHLADLPRPGHADWTAGVKFAGYQDYRGGGHFSGRLTVGLVAAGVIAKKIIAPMTAIAEIEEVGGHHDFSAVLLQAEDEGDSLGGIVGCRMQNVPAGLGEPFFDALESLLGHLLLAIPGVKAVEFGAGFAAARMPGSEYNDVIVAANGQTASNHAGGINGGISNGNEIHFRVAVRPTASIAKTQKTINMKTGAAAELRLHGRHDTCIALRLPPIVEAAGAIVLADALLLRRMQTEKRE